jgi:hypothetical protein
MSSQQQAIGHLRTVCVPTPSTKTDADLTTDWNTARGQISAPFANAGQPALQPIANTDPHIQQLMQVPWSGLFAAHLAQGATFQMVEIEPLLAFQFVVDTTRSASHCATLNTPPTRDQIFNCCLPLTLSNDIVHVSHQGQSIIIKSRSLNLRIMAEGPLQIPGVPDVFGILPTWALPFVHVVRLNGRCYLHNGFHRAFGVRMAGATEMPCLFRDVADAGAAGIQPPGTFDLQLLESGNAPTLGHLSQGRAFDVNLRASMRIIQINWSQHTMFDE